jgi:2-polyprenyl-3-methyl-5-hydroxy-6-metoxy-1,4-benzoquinol methylase
MTEVFEARSTVEEWDEDYYHPIALKLYDWAVLDMLKMMEVEAGATVLDAGCGPGVHSIRAAKAGYHVCAIDISNT